MSVSTYKGQEGASASVSTQDFGLLWPDHAFNAQENRKSGT